MLNEDLNSDMLSNQPDLNEPVMNDSLISEWGAREARTWNFWQTSETVLFLAGALYCLSPFRSTVRDCTVFGLGALMLVLFPKDQIPVAPKVKRDTFAEWSLVIFTVVCTVIMLGVGYLNSNLRFRFSLFFAAFLVYLPFAYLQHVAMERYVVMRHCRWMARDQLGWMVFLSGVLFGMFHLPFPVLIAPTMLAGWMWTYFYLKTGRLWPLALTHAFLATLFFVNFLGEVPLPSLRAHLGF